MIISPLSESHFPDLFAFEQRNWDYFKQFIPERPNDYREYDTFCTTQMALITEQQTGKSAYFIGYRDDQLIARINLRDITDTSADVGYRICQSATGKGNASTALSTIINIARQRQLQILTATVATNNPASEKVLIKNGFLYTHTQPNALEFYGQLLDFRYFKKIL